MENTAAALIKNDLRSLLCKKRKHILAEESTAAGRAALAFVVKIPDIAQCLRVGCYLATKGEFDCGPLIEYFSERKIACYVPRIIETDNTSVSMQFVRFEPGDTLCRNRFGIAEPAATAEREICPVDALDLVFVPLLGFDLQGNRLGRGAGFYDRVFGQGGCYLTGLGFEWQCVPSIPSDKWDVRLNAVLTEKRLIVF